MSNEIEAAFEAFMAHRIHGNAGTTLIVKEAFEAGAEWAQDAARNPEPKPEGVECSDCGQTLKDPRQIVIKNDLALHKNCPSAERHGFLESNEKNDLQERLETLRGEKIAIEGELARARQTIGVMEDFERYLSCEDCIDGKHECQQYPQYIELPCFCEKCECASEA